MLGQMEKNTGDWFNQREHEKLVREYAVTQSAGARGFLVVAPDRDDMLELFDIEDCTFVPIGQKGCAPSRKSGIFTNVEEIRDIFLQCSKSIHRNKKKDEPLSELMNKLCTLLACNSVSEKRNWGLELHTTFKMDYLSMHINPFWSGLKQKTCAMWTCTTTNTLSKIFPWKFILDETL